MDASGPGYVRIAFSEESSAFRQTGGGELGRFPRGTNINAVIKGGSARMLARLRACRGTRIVNDPRQRENHGDILLEGKLVRKESEYNDSYVELRTRASVPACHANINDTGVFVSLASTTVRFLLFH